MLLEGLNKLSIYKWRNLEGKTCGRELVSPLCSAQAQSRTHVQYRLLSKNVLKRFLKSRKKSFQTLGSPASKKKIYLSSKADFRLIHLNAAFVNALNLYPRPLTMTANVTANSETVTQPLGQVYYAPEGLQRSMFTPPVEEFHEVQTDHWDEVEITLKELDDNKVNFYSQSQCVIRLHFKKE